MASNNRFSLKDWNFKTWAIKNKDSLKLILAGVSGIVTAIISGLSPTWSAVLGGTVAAVSKLLVDTLDYWQSP